MGIVHRRNLIIVTPDHIGLQNGAHLFENVQNVGLIKFGWAFYIVYYVIKMLKSVDKVLYTPHIEY